MRWEFTVGGEFLMTNDTSVQLMVKYINKVNFLSCWHILSSDYLRLEALFSDVIVYDMGKWSKFKTRLQNLLRIFFESSVKMNLKLVQFQV